MFVCWIGARETRVWNKVILANLGLALNPLRYNIAPGYSRTAKDFGVLGFGFTVKKRIIQIRWLV